MLGQILYYFKDTYTRHQPTASSNIICYIWLSYLLQQQMSTEAVSVSLSAR